MRYGYRLAAICVCAFSAEAFAAPKPEATLAALDRMPFEEQLALAKQGEHNAIHHACFAYLYGRFNAPKDEAEALRWCTEGDRLGMSSSTVLLAQIYYFGSSHIYDMDRGFKLYKKAAEAGHPFAMYMTGRLLIESSNDQKVRQEGFQWLRRAADRGSKEAIQMQKSYEQPAK